MNERPVEVHQYLTNSLCGRYRMLNPASALNQGSNVRVTTYTQIGDSEYQQIVRFADIVLLQRHYMNAALNEFITSLQKVGKVVVYDLDDNLLDLDTSSRFGSGTSPEFAVKIRHVIRACQAVQCSTEALARIIRELHPEVVVLENHLDRVPPLVERSPGTGPIIVAYASSIDHGHDWALVRDSYNRTLMSLEAQGVTVETWILGDEAIFASVESARKRFFPIRPYDEYLRLLQQVNVALMPLVESNFNRCKSDVKFLEAAASGAAALGSAFLYGRTVRHGETGLLFDDSRSFEDGLMSLIVDAALTRRLARNAHQYVQDERVIQRHLQRWQDAYCSWASRKSELLLATPRCQHPS